jgi:hypothetical protein
MKLTLKKLKDMKAGTTIASGLFIDSPEGINLANSGQELRWVAVRGDIHDWAIYYHYSCNSELYVKDWGNKVRDEENIRKLVPCTEETFKMYRY